AEAPPTVYPSPSQLEATFAAASSGNLEQLQRLFQSALSESDAEAFALANDAAARTGLTALHAAASRGHLDVVQWRMSYFALDSDRCPCLVVDHCGAMVDLEDKEGETALHKAALHGHLDVVSYLLRTGKADVHAQDADGWTALHNACSKGYLDIVRWLCEHGGAAETVSHSGQAPTRGVDRKSRGGWTPLMNAASKGHLPVVLYLLSKQMADPFVRNKWGETSFDAAAAVFEIWICEVLQKAEEERWRGHPRLYNPLAVHTTVPLILYENQRLDTRLKTLAVSGAKFSVSGLGKQGRRSPFELRLLPGDSGNPNLKEVAAWRSDVQLPLLEEPFVLPKPKGAQPSGREGAERSHFWLSDWTLDLTQPRVDANEGWQYARSFNEPDDRWVPEPPPQMQRLLSGAGLVSAGLGGSSNTSNSRSNGHSAENSSSSTSWVRRRRWVRVMRRRLDIPPLPYMEADGSMYQLTAEGLLLPIDDDEDHGDDEHGPGHELGSMPVSGMTFAQDYVSRARYLADSPHANEGLGTDVVPASSLDTIAPVDAKRAIVKLERAVTELRAGILGDDDTDRRIQAEVLLNTYSRELERRRLAAGAQGLFSEDGGANEEGEDADDSDESFHYPATSPTTSTPRAASVRSHTPDYFSTSRRSNSMPTETDLTPHLSQAPEFRVPTHEAPQKILTPRWTQPTPHQVHAQWERDDTVSECRGCKRRFNFLFRKHCRRCGRIFCDRCSSHRTVLDPADVVQDPTMPETGHSSSQRRVCEPCYDQTTVNVPGRLRVARSTSMEGIVVDERNLTVPGHSNRSDASSQISDLSDCPVCSQNLADLGPASAQEAHIRACLEGNSLGPGIQQAGKYLVYRLPGESTLVGVECVICLEEFTKGSLVARLSCLCTFHNNCLSAWLQRGRSCPVHARDT
ncbi:hypothetical protein BOTBODRAFT_100253, partial [Botryobasidium botryosum FD-172 SS1]